MTDKIKCIYLDMDGVLVDLVGGIFELFKVPREHRRKVAAWDGMPAVISAHLGREVTDAELWERVGAEGESLWAGLDWLPWGPSLLRMCADVAPVVLMSTPTRNPASAAGKIMWMQRFLPEDATRRYALTPCKHHMAHEGALLIDDGQHNVDRFREHGGRAMLLPMPWNSAGHWPERRDVLALAKKALK